MDAIQKNLLEQVAGLHEIPTGAYNIRTNGGLGGRNTTANIDIITKEDITTTTAAMTKTNALKLIFFIIAFLS